MEKIKGIDQRKILKRVKTLDEEEFVLNNKLSEIKKKKEGIFKEAVNDCRLVRNSELCFQLRKKIQQNDEIKIMMGKYHIPIDHVALIEEWFERPDKLYWKGEFSCYDFKTLFESNTIWTAQRRYLYGGSRDTLKAIFRDCHNGCYVLTGYQFKFPEKQKRDWKATFKGKAA
jgi:hypothetical protein